MAAAGTQEELSNAKAGTGPAFFWLFQRSAEPYCLSIILPENRFPPHIKCGAGFFRIML